MAWLFGLAALMLLDSDTVLAAVNGAAGLFVRSVMPALFPMMVLNGLCARLSGRERRWMTVCFCWLSGSPASAQRLEGLWERGGLAGRELLPMAAATGVMSPLFLVGSLGGRLPNPAGGWLMLTAHWLGALAAAVAALGWSEGRSALAALAAVGVYYCVLWLFRQKIEHTIHFSITKNY